MPLTSPTPLPSRIGKYELIEYLGGGMAHVYRAQDTILGRTVALKILTESGNSDRELRERFLEEARTANERAIKTYTALGFKPVGIMRRYERMHTGEWADGLLMDMLAEELVNPS